MIVSSEAIVLRTMKYRETSRIATLLTVRDGKISVLAKGARDRKSRLGAALQPMNHVAAVYYKKESRELQLLTQCDLVESFRGLTETIERMAAGMAAVELTDAVTPAEEANPSLFALLADTLKTASSATKNAGNALYYFEMRLLENLGFKPDLHHCYQCGGNLAGLPQATRMNYNGIFCPSCAGKGHGQETLSAAGLRLLQRLQEIADPQVVTRITLSAQLRGEVAGVLRRLLLGHVEGLRTLKSEGVFSALL